jgi:hypothetical protein
MIRERSRNSSFTVIAAIIMILIMALVSPARAQITSNPPLFQSAVSYGSGGANGGSIAVGDLNGDGKLDLVVANRCISEDDCPNDQADDIFGHRTVGVLLGNGDGTFRPVVTYDSGGYTSIFFADSVAVGDLNGDGKLDILVTNPCSVCSGGTLAVLFGNGDGSFGWPMMYNSFGFNPFSVALKDVNGDGSSDLLVANLCYQTPTCSELGCTCEKGSVGVLLSDGHGGFSSVRTYDSGAPWTRSIAVGDVNGDGKPDLVVANDGRLGVLLNIGDGTFQAAVTYLTSGSPARSVALGDVNGDGKPDLAVASDSGGVDVLVGNGDGTFRAAATYGVSGIVPSVALGDVNGDGKPDLVVAASNVWVLLGNGDGTFQSPVFFSLGGHWTYSLVMADLNADGKLDLMSGTFGSVVVLIGKKAVSTTTVVSSLNPSSVSRAVTFRATVSSTTGLPPNGEIVTFKNGSTVLGMVPLNGGKASLTISSLPVGVYTIAATYGGDSNFSASTSSGLRQVVSATTRFATSTTLVSSLNPSVYGQKITWAAMVTNPGSVPPTGPVVFKSSQLGSTFTLGTGTLNASGVAMLTKSNLTATYPYPITAVYLGDAWNTSSTSAVLNQVVKQTTTGASITSSANPSSRGQAVAFTARITSSTVNATGPVTFIVGNTVVGTAQLSGGIARFTTSTLPVGSSTVKVTFFGNSNVAKSSASLLQTVH